MNNKLPILFMIILLTVACNAYPVPDGYKRYFPSENSSLKITFLYPDNVEIKQLELLQLERERYAASNPINKQEDYRGGFIFHGYYDPSGKLFKHSLESSKLIASSGGFELLKEEIISKDSITIYWFQFLREPDVYTMLVPGIQNIFVFWLDDWAYGFTHLYPTEEEGPFAKLKS